MLTVYNFIICKSNISSYI